ncbi:MAG: G1 family glutamic endopeptidase [Acidimicrobiales bacterium]
MQHHIAFRSRLIVAGVALAIASGGLSASAVATAATQPATTHAAGTGATTPTNAPVSLLSVHAAPGGPSTAPVAAGAACQPLKIFPSPPSGFNPVQANDSQLQQYGFPPRPPGSNAGALSVWTTAVTDARTRTTPHPICSDVTHALVYSGIWAGHVVPYNYVSSSTFTWAESSWTQPLVPGNSNYSNYNAAPDASFWTGLGISSLIQAGADSIATGTPQYRFWTEDYPYEGTIWEGPTIRPGQEAYVYLDYQGNNQTYYFLENETTGSYQPFTNYTPDVGYNAANFINERVLGYYLPDFGSTGVSSNYFGNSSNGYQLTPNNDIWFMTSNCQSNGTMLSQPSGVDASGYFSQNWEAGSPFADSC